MIQDNEGRIYNAYAACAGHDDEGGAVALSQLSCGLL